MAGSAIAPIDVAKVEVGHRGIDATVEEFRFQAGLDLTPFTRIKHVSGNVRFRLGLENLGVAGIGRKPVGQFVDRAGVRRHLGLDGLPVGGGTAEEVGRRGVVPAQPTTADQREPVERLDAQLSVEAELLRPGAGLGGVVDRRTGQTGVPVVDVLIAGDRARALEHGAFEMLVVGTDDDVVLLAEQLERLAHMGVDCNGIMAVVTRQPTGVVRVAAPGDDVAIRSHIAVGPCIEEIDLGMLVAGRELGVAAILELVLQLGDVVGDVVVEVVPVLAGEGGPVEVQQGAVLKGRQAIEGRDAARLMVDGKRRRGVGADVGLHGAIGNADAVGHVIDETVLVLEHADETPAHGPGLVERTRHVDLAALVGPRAERALETRLEIALRLLEPHVDRAGRLAIAAKQAGGTAQDLDVIDDGKIGWVP